MGYDPKYDMTVYASAGMVRSSSDGARAHRVQLPDCDCADFINRKGQLAEIDGMPVITICKHIAEFMNRAGGWKRPAVPEPRLAYTGLSRAAARILLTRTDRGNLTVRDADALLRAAEAHPGLAAEAAPGDGTAVKVTDLLGSFEVVLPEVVRH